MGQQTGASINEAVFLLNRFAPEILEDARKEFPRLSSELSLGREGGEADTNDAIELDRAQVAIRALQAARLIAEQELTRVHSRMVSAKRRRLWSQIISLICSSGVLASLALDQRAMSIVAAVLALLAAIGTITAEHQERLLKQGTGDIYEAYEKAAEAAYKAGRMADHLEILVRHSANGAELKPIIEDANSLCDDLVGWLIKMTGSDATPQSVAAAPAFS
jgi:hypothetical protein